MLVHEVNLDHLQRAKMKQNIPQSIHLCRESAMFKVAEVAQSRREY